MRTLSPTMVFLLLVASFFCGRVMSAKTSIRAGECQEACAPEIGRVRGATCSCWTDTSVRLVTPTSWTMP